MSCLRNCLLYLRLILVFAGNNRGLFGCGKGMQTLNFSMVSCLVEDEVMQFLVFLSTKF